LRLAVVSPFLDRQHGTEMCIVEQIERLARLEGWSIDVYSQRVEQLNGVRAAPGSSKRVGSIVWHKISDIPGPHLLKFLWWFLLSHWRRRRDRRSGRVFPDLIYTPGTNCLDADVIAVHIVFHAFYERIRSDLALRRVPVWNWPRSVHRKLYYRLIMLLEQKMYRDSRVRLVAVSRLVAKQLENHFGATDVAVIPNAVDTHRFTPEACRARRAESRRALGFAENEYVALLIGNDWKKKGLDSLFRAAAQLRDLPLRLLVVGKDDPGLFRGTLQTQSLNDKIRFEKPSPDVLQFYAAADLYVGPSLEDAFNLPIVEAMACGLPVIASMCTGASENITDGQTGLILSDPQDDASLAQLVRRIYADAGLRASMGEAAARFVQANCSWDQNAARTRECLEEVLESRRKS
jgi:glycosyltransferase involved in cell wall biosynthesis